MSGTVHVERGAAGRLLRSYLIGQGYQLTLTLTPRSLCKQFRHP